MEYIEVVSDIAKSQNASKPHHNFPPQHSRHHSPPSRHGRSSSADPHVGSRSIFGIGNSKESKSHSSSVFGGNSSYYRRSPRKSYLSRMYKKLRRLFRELTYYVKRHPMKVFMLVIIPLITSGALSKLLSRFGIHLPSSLQRLLKGTGSFKFGRSSNSAWSKKFRKLFGGLGAMGSLIGVARMFK